LRKDRENTEKMDLQKCIYLKLIEGEDPWVREKEKED